MTNKKYLTKKEFLIIIGIGVFIFITLNLIPFLFKELNSFEDRFCTPTKSLFHSYDCPFSIRVLEFLYVSVIVLLVVVSFLGFIKIGEILLE